MTGGDNKKPSGKPSPGDEAEARKERQAAALRANLRRRNAQRRERESIDRDSGAGDDAA
jgi:hypothetical protein